MNAQISDNVNYYQGTTTVPNGWAGQPYNVPNTCPGCGRCKDCGRPYETQPYNLYGLPLPWRGYPNPYIGDPVYPFGGPTWSGTLVAGTMNQTINSGWASGLQVWN